MIRHTVFGKDRRVLSVDAGFFERMRYRFPKDKVFTITEAEKEQEKQRVAAILEKIEKTNGLHHVDVAFFRTDYPIDFNSEGSFPNGLGTKNEKYEIQVNPLMSKALSDDGLALVLSHELGHIHCRHPRQIRILEAATKESGGQVVNGSYEIKSFALSCEKEADMVGALFMTNAGYNLQKGLASYKDMNHDKVFMEKLLIPANDHPSIYEREDYLKKFTKGMVSFSVKDKNNYVDSIESRLTTAKGAEATKTELLDRACRAVSSSNRFLDRYLLKLSKGNLDGRMKIEPLIQEYQNTNRIERLKDSVKRFLPNNNKLLSVYCERFDIFNKYAIEIKRDLSVPKKAFHFARVLSRTSLKTLSTEIARTREGR